MRKLYYIFLLLLSQKSCSQQNLNSLEIKVDNQVISKTNPILIVHGIVKNINNIPIALIVEDTVRITHPTYWHTIIKFENGKTLSSNAEIKANIRKSSEYRVLKFNESDTVVFKIDFTSLIDEYDIQSNVKYYGNYSIRIHYKDNFKTNPYSIPELISNEVVVFYSE